MDRVRLGIAGIGNIAQLNVRGYLAHDRCDVVALCDPREDKATAMARQWDVPKVYTELDRMLADDEIDAVEILTPTYLHHDHVIAAARAGKHISCQKPMANSVAEARAMMAAVEEAGVVFRVTECAFHYEPLQKAKAATAAVQSASDHAMIIGTVLAQELPASAQVGEVAQAIEQTEELKDKLADTAETLAEVSDELEQQITKQHEAAKQLVATRAKVEALKADASEQQQSAS